MEKTESQDTPASADTSNKRAYPRYPVSIKSILQDGSQNRYACSIRNVCVGGMFIVFTSDQQPSMADLAKKGGVIRVSFSITSKGEKRDISFDGRVMRFENESIGMAFINPDLDVLQAVLRYAANAEKSSETDLETTTDTITANKQVHPNNKTIKEQCDEATRENLNELLKQTFSSIHSKLFELSGTAEHFQVASMYYNGANEIKEKSDSLSESIQDSVSQQLVTEITSNTGVKETDSLSSSDFELSLVEDEALEGFLAGSDAVNTIEIRNKDSLALLAENLSVIHNKKITDKNNPYGAKLFVDSFQDAIKTLNLDPIILRICYAAFKETLIKLSGSFYVRLNDICLENGIQVQIATQNRIIKKQEIASPNGTAGQIPGEVPQKQRTPTEGQSLEQKGVEEQERTAVPPEHHKAATSRVQTHQVESQLSTTSAKPISEHNAQPQPIESKVDDANLYKVVGELMELRKFLKKQPSLPMAGSPETSTSTPAATYNTQELIQAIDAIKSDTSNVDINTANSISQHLSDASSQDDALTSKEISQEDAEVLVISDELFEAMLYDPCVDQSVKPWIKQLKHPIVKLALTDNSVFTDKKHIVRVVIDKISQLEYYKEDSKVNAPHNLQKIITTLIDKANKEFDGSNQVFHRIDKQLDKLSQIQKQAYNDNINDVRKACNEIPPITDQQYTDEQYSWLDDAEWEKWFKCARRIKKGDWVSYKIVESEMKKLRLAWVDEKETLFVFVNYLGLQALTLTIKDFALHLFHEKITFLDSANEPAVDRAQLTMLQKLHGQLLYQTTHDQLTDLVNRREFERILEHNIGSAKLNGLRHAVCFLDVDNFNVINDTCGYAGGDELLKELSGLMKETLGSNGVVARLGSDEFGILLKNCSLDEALNATEDLLEAVYNFKFTQDNKSLSVGISVGLVQINNQSDSPAALLQAAEASSAVAKEAGGNRLQLYHSGLARITQRNEMMKWVGAIDKMIENDSFLLRCQRIDYVTDKTNALPYYEILLSIIDDNKQVLLPQKFIEAAEVYNRMASVDRWVITNMLDQVAKSPEVLSEIGGIAIKLSTQSITDDGLFQYVADELNRTNVPAEKLCFELTESIGINNLSDTATFIKEMKSIGCQCVLDDFGSGSSSYRCLKQLPFDFLKIDGNFIRDLQNNNNDYAVVKSICEVAHFMNKQVIAEYVESEETLNRLKEIGVDLVQGFYIEEPRNLTEMLSGRSM